MANDDFDLDDFDLDDFTDGLDIHDQTGDVKDDRSPVVKVTSGFLEGVKETSTDTNFIRKTLTRALPSGYGRAADLVEDVTSTGKELYDTAVSEIQPAMRDVRRVTRRIMPRVKKYLPDSVSEKIDDHLKEDEERGRLNETKTSADEQAIKFGVGDIFNTQIKADQVRYQEKEAKDFLRDHAQQKRHEDTLRQQDSIREGINRLVGYQDRVTSGYQKKSLELQYRQYFAARDLLEYFKAHSMENKTHLKAIAKNTGLPEFRKVELLEASGQDLRDRFISRAHGAIGDYTENFREKLVDNVRNKIKGAGERFREGMSASADMGDSMGDAAEMGVDIDPTEFTSSMVGNDAASRLGMLVAHYARRQLDRSERISEVGDRVGYIAENHRELINEWARSDVGEEGMTGGLVRWIKELVPTFSLDERVGDELSTTADEAVHFNALARRSITEIIPGYLSRIHHELQIIRTGDPEVDRMLYNIDRQEFTGTRQAKTDIANRILSGRDATNIRERTDNILDIVDEEGGLSDEAREALSQQIIRDSSIGKAFTPGRYASREGLTSVTDDTVSEEIQNLFQETFQDSEGQQINNAETAARLRRAATQVRALQQYIPDVGRNISAYADLGNRDLLRELGATYKWGTTDRIDYDRFWDALGGMNGTTGNSNESTFEGYRQSPLLDRTNDMSAPDNDRSRDMVSDLGPTPRERTERQEQGGRGQVSLLEQISGSVDRILAQMTRGGQEDKGQTLRPVHLEEQTDRILTGIRESSVSEEAVRSADRLDEIASLLKTNNIKTSADKSVDGIGSTIKNVGDKALGLAGGVLGMYGKMFSLGGEAIGKTFDVAGGLTGSLFDKFRSKKKELTDLYIKGQKHPVLLKYKLKLGMYKDRATGKVIRTIDDLKDVKGAIVDEYGEVVVRTEDLISGLYKFDGEEVVRKASDFASKQMEKGRGILSKIADGASKLFRRTKDEMSDLYIKGQKHPALLAYKLRMGLYKDQVTGKVIRSIEDLKNLKGPIVDEYNNVVVTVEDAIKGLHDKKGKGIFKASGNLLKKYYSTVMGAYAAPVKFGLSAVRKTVGAGVDFLKRKKDIYIKGEKTPRILASVMEKGGYISKATGKVIESIKDIDGTVIDRDGNVVMTLAEMRQGLVDRFGREYRKVSDRVADLAKKALSVPGKILSMYGKAIAGTARMGRDILSGITGRLGGKGGSGGGIDSKEFKSFTKENINVLKEIRDILDQRLEKRVKGDFDGDGFRDGGWREQLAEDREEAEQEDGEGGKDDTQSSGMGFLKKLMAGAGGLFGRGDGDGDDGDTIIGGADFGGDKDGKGRKGRRGRRGRLGRMKDMGARAWNWAKNSKALRFGGKLLGGLGAGLAAHSAYSNVKEGDYGDAAIDTGLGLGSLALTTGGTAAVLGGAKAALGGAAAVIGGVISAPVVLTVGALAGAAAGGYFLYKHLTKVKLSEFDKIRYLQYGVDPDEEKDRLQKVMYLEEELWKDIQFSRGEAKINISNERAQELAEGFDVDLDNKVELTAWLRWMSERFKPVFLAHAKAANELAPNADLLDVDDKLNAREKLQYLKAVKFEPDNSNGPYFSRVNPFGDGENITVRIPRILKAFRNLEAAIKEESKEGRKGSTDGSNTVAGSGILKDAVDEQYAISKEQKESLRGVLGQGGVLKEEGAPEEEGTSKPTVEVSQSKSLSPVVTRQMAPNAINRTRVDLEDNKKTEEIINDRSTGYMAAASFGGGAVALASKDDMAGAIKQREIGSSDRDSLVPQSGGKLVKVSTPALLTGGGEIQKDGEGNVISNLPIKPIDEYSQLNEEEEQRQRERDKEVSGQKDRLEREAKSLDVQNRHQNTILNRSMEGVLNVLNQSYQTQLSMDRSLKSMNQILEEMHEKKEREELEEKAQKAEKNLFDRFFGDKPTEIKTTNKNPVNLSRDA